MSRPRLLDLFCGAGGAAMGYHRAGFDVVGVDVAPQPNYPFEFHQADAMTYPLDGFDAIHASPPCQRLSKALRGLVREDKWGEYLEATRARLDGTIHVIENVPGAPIGSQRTLWGLDGILLCGSMFDLTVETPAGLRGVRRHRLFESSAPIYPPQTGCNHRLLSINPYNARARKRDSLVGSAADRLLVVGMGLTWVESGWDQGREAIPPVYTEWIGRQLLAFLDNSL